LSYTRMPVFRAFPHLDSTVLTVLASASLGVGQ